MLTSRPEALLGTVLLLRSIGPPIENRSGMHWLLLRRGRTNGMWPTLGVASKLIYRNEQDLFAELDTSLVLTRSG
jgi:hypothetical protein